MAFDDLGCHLTDGEGVDTIGKTGQMRRSSGNVSGRLSRNPGINNDLVNVTRTSPPTTTSG